MVRLRLLPRDETFTDLFVADGENLLAAARALEEMLTAYDRLDERVERIRALEHTGDEIDAQLDARLEHAFITPFDREDIHELASRLDDVVDGIQEIAEAMIIYRIAQPTDAARELGRILAAQAVELNDALHKLERLKELDPHIARIHELENQADGLSRAAIGALFEGHDALDVIKWRDIYHALEESIDAAEDAGEIIQRMIHKGG